MNELPRLPHWTHVPGVTAGADEEPLVAVKALVPERFSGRVPANHPAVLYGVTLCDRGFYWEAHEVLEAVWMASDHNGRDRLALRAVIQLANAGLKLRMKRPKAASRLLKEAVACLSELRKPQPGPGLGEALDAPILIAAIEELEEDLTHPVPLVGPAFNAAGSAGRVGAPCIIVHDTGSASGQDNG